MPARLDGTFQETIVYPTTAVQLRSQTLTGLIKIKEPLAQQHLQQDSILLVAVAPVTILLLSLKVNTRHLAQLILQLALLTKNAILMLVLLPVAQGGGLLPRPQPGILARSVLQAILVVVPLPLLLLLENIPLATLLPQPPVLRGTIVLLLQ